MTMTSQFVNMTLPSNFFDVVLFYSSSLYTGPNVMSMSSLVLEAWQFSLKEIDQNSGNRKYPGLSFARYPETGMN